ncbi:hypothetical protein D9M71_777450 [compost metagenome]
MRPPTSGDTCTCCTAARVPTLDSTTGIGPDCTLATATGVAGAALGAGALVSLTPFGDQTMKAAANAATALPEPTQ